MLKNYLKVAISNLLHYKWYSLVSILGLAVGLSASILILLFINFEFSYDEFHADKDRIYRVSIVSEREGGIENESHVFTPPIGPAMYEDFPEVENFVRLSTLRSAYFINEDEALKIDGIHHADSTFFDIFTYPLLVGNPSDALKAPYSIVLTEQTAHKIFGSENPVGKIFRYEGSDIYRVTGVVSNPPANSHLQFNALISFSTLYQNPDLYLDWNGGNQYISYVKLTPNASREMVESKFPDFMWKYTNNWLAEIGIKYSPYLQPLTDIHLYYEDDKNSNLNNVIVFSAIAFLILLIACINFINLTNARAGKRAKEIGVRKVLGADRGSLVRQFLTESIFFSLIAMGAAIFLVEWALPVFRQLFDVEFSNIDYGNIYNLAGLVGLVVCVGVFSGVFPAIYMSSLPIEKIFKGVFNPGKSRLKLRHILVVLQFTISIILIICALVVNSQLNFMSNTKLGYEKENIVAIPLMKSQVKQKYELLIDKLASLPGIVNVAASSEIPGGGFTSNGYFPEGYASPIMINVLDMDANFLNTFDIELVEGRNFSSDFPTDKSSYLVNEAFVEMTGWDKPVGKTVTRNEEHQIIGVVKDFHFATLHNLIKPLIFTYSPESGFYNYFSVKINSQNISGTINSMEEVWRSTVSDIPFEYTFLSDEFDRLYRWEQRFKLIVLYFSLIAIFIAALGLLSLASFAAEQRTKEIGIRKVFGASIASITCLISRDFIVLAIIANLTSFPIAYYFMNKWLQNFAYRTQIGFGVFIIAGAAAVLTAGITVGFQAVRAGLADPVKSLKYE